MISSLRLNQHLINLCIEKNIPINHTKIQKLLYIMYGIRLAQGGMLTDETPVYMPHGPVFGGVLSYNRANNFENQDVDISELSEDDNKIIDFVLNKYGRWSAKALSEWSHHPGSPWWEYQQEGIKYGQPFVNSALLPYFQRFIKILGLTE